MSFLHISLATLGGSLVAIPIVLHLLMRRKPKPLTFPALRFVKARRESNQRRLRLRQLALLALRCAAICCLALALARPRVPTATAGNWWLLVGLLAAAGTIGAVALFGWTRHGVGKWASGALGLVAALLLVAAGLFFVRMQNNPAVALLEDAEAPVAAALLFDVSPRMSYRHQNQTRLEVAQELGQWILQQLAFDSDIAVLDTATTGATFSVDRSTARKSIRALLPANQARPLPQLLDAAVRLLRESEHARKELYVFTDMTGRSWLTQAQQSWQDELEGETPIILYVLDVGVDTPKNFRLGSPELTNAYLAGGQQLDLNIELSGDGVGGAAQLQVSLEKPDPTLPIVVDGRPVLPEQVLRGQKEIELPKDGTALARFSLGGPPPGTHHGQIRLLNADGLDIDNQRFFTIRVTETRRALVVTGPGTEPSLLTDVLGPVGDDDGGAALFQCDLVRFDRLAAESLADYDVVALLDPPPLSATTWQALGKFVHDGGGLGILLGRNAVPVDQFNSPEALELLPGAIDRQWRAGGQDIYLTLDSSDHRLLRGLRMRETTIPWNNFPVYRHWGFGQLRDGIEVVIRYGNGQPAIVESFLGAGKILTMTTPVSDALNIANRAVWNMLPTGENAWPYFVLTLDMFRYLSASGSLPLNYEIGETATIRHSFTDGVKLFTPSGSWEEVASTENQVTVPFTSVPGSYRLKGNPADAPRPGISVNLPSVTTQLTRLNRDQIAERLGTSSFRLARKREDIVREIGEARMGREFFPWLMVAVVFVLAMEHLMANRFYAETSRQVAAPAAELPWEPAR